MTAEKVREDRIRRMLARQGYALTRSNRRDPRAWDYGIYIITHMLASGADSGRVAGYCESLDEAERWALEGDRAAELEDASYRPEEDWEEIGTVTVGANWVAQLGGGAGDGPHVMKVLRHKDRNIRFIKLDDAPAYLARLPAPADVPAGKVVVHNQVTPTRQLGSRGFRAWLAKSSEELEACPCGWAPELGTHYRVVGKS
ncbi:MAG TPA: hypothetical protein VK162_18970 [Streptosporangiaceae bacterium]|nr:hypothetical protein [Streptosporangiaceae bacterium]